MTYQIRVTRSGGICGYAEAWAKVDGKIFETEDKEEAEKLVAKWIEKANGPCSTAHITYEVVEFY